MVRRRRVPTRTLVDRLIVARPLDGAPVVLAPTAAVIWRLLDGWTSTEAVDRGLADAFPDVSEQERVEARTEILAMLHREDLLERG